MWFVSDQSPASAKPALSRLEAQPFKRSMSWSSPVPLAALVAVSGTLVLYGGGLSLPFYSDDLLQVPWAKTASFWDILHTANPYQHYRPVQFVIWHLLYVSLGDLSPLLLHSLNLLGEAAVGTLVGWMLSEEPRNRLMAPLGAGFFVAFPFAFDVVLWPSSFAYPLAAGLTLGAVLSYRQARRLQQSGPHILGIILTLLAGLSHEAGVAAGASVFWAEVCLSRRRSYGWASAYVLASALPALLVAHYSGVPLSVGLLAQWKQDLIITLQALAYPVSWLSGLLGQAGPISATADLLGLAVAALGLVYYLSRQAEREAWFWLGLGWSLGWAVIPMATQQFDWLRDPPRVLYPSAMGISVLWAAGLASLIHRLSGLRATLLRIALAALLLIVPAMFLVGRLNVYLQGGNLLWQAISISESSQGAALVVNLPGRLTPHERWYPLGHEGFIPLPPPTDAGSLAAAHGSVPSSVVARSAGGLLPRLPFAVELTGPPVKPADVEQASSVYVLGYHDQKLQLEKVGAIRAKGAETPLATFGSEVDVLSVECRRSGVGRVELAIEWELNRPVARDLTVFAHLLAADGAILAQADGYPVGGLYPFSQWRQGEIVCDWRSFDDFVALPATIALGVWEPATGRRLPAVRRGVRLADDAFVCRIANP